MDRLSGRNLKQKVLELLKAKDFCSSLEQLKQFPGKIVINPLLSFLLDLDDLVKWRAVAALGVVVSLMAETDMEAARVIMRRLMWSLNDESGGIGWGAPEAMSEIMAKNDKIAQEYYTILISYLDEDGNHLEYEALQKGLIWGVARLSTIRPDLMKPAAVYLYKYLDSNDASIRGLSAFGLGLLRARDSIDHLNRLMHDYSEFQTFFGNELKIFKVSDFAEKAVSLINE